LTRGIKGKRKKKESEKERESTDKNKSAFYDAVHAHWI